MVHPDQAGRLCGPLHYASPLNSTQPKFVELVQQAQTQCNWLRCWAIENGLASVPCPAAAAAASAQRQRVCEDRPPQLPGQAAASSQVPSNFRRPPAEYSRASVDQTEDAAAAQQACGRTAESQTEGQAGGANYDHTYLAERLRQHQPAWQPTNGYGYDYSSVAVAKQTSKPRPNSLPRSVVTTVARPTVLAFLFCRGSTAASRVKTSITTRPCFVFPRVFWLKSMRSACSRSFGPSAADLPSARAAGAPAPAGPRRPRPWPASRQGRAASQVGTASAGPSR